MMGLVSMKAEKTISDTGNCKNWVSMRATWSLNDGSFLMTGTILLKLPYLPEKGSLFSVLEQQAEDILGPRHVEEKASFSLQS